jgi:hypothetical protein
MDISSVSLDSYLMSRAVDTKSSSVQGEITMAVMKQQQNSQEVVADALVKMISTPPPRIDGTGSIINIAA